MPAGLKPGRPKALLLALLALALVVFAVPAGRRPFWSSDEARFAVLAQDILDHDRWLVPYLRGEFYLNKPQLYFWSIALVSLPAGRVTELTSAVPSVVAAVATVAAVAAIGRLLWSWPVGLLAGLLLVATPAVYVFTHAVLADMMMTSFMTWALYFCLRALREGSRLAAVAFYACVAAAVLTKGFAGFTVLVAAAAATALTRGAGGLVALRPLYGLGVLCAAALVWFAPYLASTGGGFVSRVLVNHYAPWYLQGALGPRLGQLIALLVNFMPWTLLLAAAVVWWRRQPDEGRRWIVAATLTLALLLALSGTQRARYLLPVYPGMALLVAEFVAHAGRAGAGRALAAAMWATAALAALGAASAPLLLPRVSGHDRVFVPEGAGETAALVALAGAMAAVLVVAVRRGSHAAGVAAAALIVVAALLLEGVTYPPRYTRDYDLRPVARAAAQLTVPGVPVIVYPDTGPSFDFYVRRPVLSPPSPAAAAALASELPSVIVTTGGRWTELATALAPPWRVVTTRNVAGKQMILLAP